MENINCVHCFFEQSGTFKNEFKKLGIKAVDYDIQNNFGETDFIIDLFVEIEKAYDDKPSIYDKIQENDLIFSFFPCIYFCENNNLYFTCEHYNVKNKTNEEKIVFAMKRMEERLVFYKLFCKMFAVAYRRNIKMIVENPYFFFVFLTYNFQKPTLIDKNRAARGDFFVKPTQYWFVNCEPTFGMYSEQIQRNIKKVMNQKCSSGGICSKERSMISSDYARNFICDFVIGKEQKFTQKSLF